MVSTEWETILRMPEKTINSTLFFVKNLNTSAMENNVS